MGSVNEAVLPVPVCADQECHVPLGRWGLIFLEWGWAHSLNQLPPCSAHPKAQGL